MALKSSKFWRAMSVDSVLFQISGLGYLCYMNVFSAIDRMRQLSSEGKSFSFSFMSYSYERRRSDGVVHVEHARLRKQSRKENNRFADYMLNFIDMDTMEYGTCWQPLLLEFDGIELELS